MSAHIRRRRRRRSKCSRAAVVALLGRIQLYIPQPAPASVGVCGTDNSEFSDSCARGALVQQMCARRNRLATETNSCRD